MSKHLCFNCGRLAVVFIRIRGRMRWCCGWCARGARKEVY